MMKLLLLNPGYKNKLICMFILALIVSCNNKKSEINSPDNELLLIEKTINGAIGWAKDKDFNLLHSVIANDTAYLEVHPGNRVVKGFEEFKKLEDFFMNPDFKAVRYEIKELRINISRSGDAAWWFCILDDINEWKGQKAAWENTRWTGVLEKREGKWVIMQQHFSFASE